MDDVSFGEVPLGKSSPERVEDNTEGTQDTILSQVSGQENIISSAPYHKTHLLTNGSRTTEGVDRALQSREGLQRGHGSTPMGCPQKLLAGEV